MKVEVHDSSTATDVRLNIRRADTTNVAINATLSTLDAWTRLSALVTADATETWTFRVRQAGAGNTDFYFTAVEIAELPTLTATLTVTPRVLLTSGAA